MKKRSRRHINRTGQLEAYALDLNEGGQGMAEYIIIVILVAIIVLVAIRLFGRSVYNQFNNATEEIETLESEDFEAETGGGGGGGGRGGGGPGIGG